MGIIPFEPLFQDPYSFKQPVCIMENKGLVVFFSWFKKMSVSAFIPNRSDPVFASGGDMGPLLTMTENTTPGRLTAGT